MSTYSYNLQYAHFEHQQSEDRGIASPGEILKAFDGFDWPGQVAAANEIQNISPTFSVRDVDGQRSFWVSAYGEPDDFQFVNQYTYQGEIRALFGLIRTRGAIKAPSPELSLESARRGIELFVAGDHDALHALLSQ